MIRRRKWIWNFCLAFTKLKYPYFSLWYVKQKHKFICQMKWCSSIKFLCSAKNHGKIQNKSPKKGGKEKDTWTLLHYIRVLSLGKEENEKREEMVAEQCDWVSSKWTTNNRARRRVQCWCMSAFCRVNVNEIFDKEPER